MRPSLKMLRQNSRQKKDGMNGIESIWKGDQKKVSRLVAVLVAHGVADCVHHIANLHVGPEVVQNDRGVHGKRCVASSSAVNVASAGTVGVLPDAEVTVNHAVVEPEDWVTGRSIHVAHDAADTVVPVGVRALLSALGEVLVVLQRLATVDDVGVDLGQVVVVAVAREAVVLVGGAGTGANVQGKVGELLGQVSYTFWTTFSKTRTPSLTQFPPMLMPPSHLLEKMDESWKRPVYLVSSNQSRLSVKEHSSLRTCSKAHKKARCHTMNLRLL